MLRLTEIVDGPERGQAGEGAGQPPARTLTLSFEDRRRSRLLARLDDGGEAALFLPRGSHLREGSWLRGEGVGALVRVRAAAETLSVAVTADPHLLARAAYHLGNRHVPLQVGQGWVAYQHDHVLDELARTLGLTVTTRTAPFEPEGGGYSHPAGGGHGHGHRHDHHATGQGGDDAHSHGPGDHHDHDP